MSRLRSRNRHSTSKPFIMLYKDLMRSKKYVELKPYSIVLLLELLMQYNGNNNGDFCATWNTLKIRGWRSRGTIYKALNQLIKLGFIIKTRQGGKNKACLYAVTFFAIDDCKGKLDVPSSHLPLHLWKEP